MNEVMLFEGNLENNNEKIGTMEFEADNGKYIALVGYVYSDGEWVVDDDNMITFPEEYKEDIIKLIRN